MACCDQNHNFQLTLRHRSVAVSGQWSRYLGPNEQRVRGNKCGHLQKKAGLSADSVCYSESSSGSLPTKG